MKFTLILGVLAMTAMVFYSAVQSLPAANSSSISANEITDIENTTAEIEANQAEVDAQSTILNSIITTLRAENSDQKTILENALADRDQLESRLAETTQRVSAHEAENAVLAADKGNLAKQLTELTADFESRENALSDAESAIENLERERDELTRQLAEGAGDTAEPTDTQVTEALETALAERDQLQSQLEETTQRVTTHEVAIEDLERERDELTQQLAEGAGDTAEPQPQVADAQLEQNAVALAEAEEQIAVLTEMSTVQGQATSELTEEVEKSEALVTALTTEKASLTQEVAKRDAVIAGLMSRAEASIVSLEASCQERTDAVFSEVAIGFDTGTTAITENSISLLEELANIASDCVQEDLTLEIEGHTSDEGGIASNLLLSDGRAQAIRDFLASSGIPVSAMRAIGFGGREPIADNNTSDGQSRNQRIVFDWGQS